MSKVFGNSALKFDTDGFLEFQEAAKSDDLISYLHRKDFLFEIKIYNNSETVLYSAHVNHPDLGSRRVEFASDTIPFKSFLSDLMQRIILEKDHKAQVIKSFETMAKARDKQEMDNLKALIREVWMELKAEAQSAKTGKQ